jgi:hypothetical protein
LTDLVRETGPIAFWVSHAAVFGGIAIFIGVGAWKGLLSSRASKYRPGRFWWSATLRRQYRQLRSLDQPPPGDLPALWTMADALIENRWWSLVSFGLVLEETGIAITNGPLWRSLAAVFAVLMATMAVLTEIQARAGAAFLLRYPVVEVPES